MTGRRWSVTELKGRPLQVTQDGGELTISYESLSWEGLLGFLKPRHDSVAVTITVPADCPIQLGVLSASAIVSGLRSGAAVKGMSGDVTLDGVTGNVEAETMSGEIAARDIDGEVRFKSMSGGLVLADGWLDRLEANTMSGQIAADVTPPDGRRRAREHDVRRRDAAAACGERRPGAAAVHLGRGPQRVRIAPDRQGTRLTYRKR